MKKTTAAKAKAKANANENATADVVENAQKTALGNENITELVFILDKSGSMWGLESDTIGGYNAVLKEHQEAQGEGTLTTILFSDRAETLHDRVNIADVAPLTEDDYRVGGCTALLDAVGSTIEHIARVQGYMPADHKAGHIIFVITTDGLENASSDYDYLSVEKLIRQKQELGWEFFFLGANMDAVGEAAKIGIYASRASSYIADEKGTAVMFEALAGATKEARECCCAARIDDGSWKEAILEDMANRG